MEQNFYEIMKKPLLERLETMRVSPKDDLLNAHFRIEAENRGVEVSLNQQQMDTVLQSTIEIVLGVQILEEKDEISLGHLMDLFSQIMKEVNNIVVLEEHVPVALWDLLSKETFIVYGAKRLLLAGWSDSIYREIANCVVVKFICSANRKEFSLILLVKLLLCLDKE